MPITGLHAIVYSTQDEATRKFFADVLGLPFVDAGHGWLIFKAPPAELAVHPADADGRHELYLMCDDIEQTIAELKAKGVATAPISEQRWGRLTHVTLPGGAQLGLYEPKHPKAIDLTD
jgi:catechol 2,3-dioxygenase-like lactoylglutathione lyase family enzyme